MKVSKILNNNLVLSRNAENEEIIVKGLGIGFHAKRGDTIDESLVEKIFYPENHQNSIQIQQYLLSIPEEYLDFVQKFVDRVKEEEPDLHLNNSIYLSLSDHIMGTVERFGNGISLKNVLLLDIQQLYRKEYEYGLKMVEAANRKFEIQLPADDPYAKRNHKRGKQNQRHKLLFLFPADKPSKNDKDKRIVKKMGGSKMDEMSREAPEQQTRLRRRRYPKFQIRRNSREKHRNQCRRQEKQRKPKMVHKPHDQSPETVGRTPFP